MTAGSALDVEPTTRTRANETPPDLRGAETLLTMKPLASRTRAQAAPREWERPEATPPPRGLVVTGDPDPNPTPLPHDTTENSPRPPPPPPPTRLEAQYASPPTTQHRSR